VPSLYLLTPVLAFVSGCITFLIVYSISWKDGLSPVRIILIGIADLLVCICTAVTGLIGFLGLIVPYIRRLLVGKEHKVLIPMAIEGGTILYLFITEE